MAAGDVEVNIDSPNARKGIFCDGTDDWVILTEFDLGSSYCLSFWFKTILGDRSSVFGLSAGFDNYLYIYPTNNQFVFEGYSSGVTTSLSIPAGINDGKWHHAILNVASNVASLYLDGVLVDSDTFSSDFKISKIGQGYGSLPFNGELSDIKIYGNTLSSVELSSLISGVDVRNNLIHEYTFADDTYNDSSESNNGTNNGTRIGIFEDTIAASIKADRTTANDIYLIASTAKGRQAITTVIEEAP